MRNFKKFLALVLAMLMVSACAVSVAAFDDVADTDDYAEAVELLADLGVISGRNDGTNNFYPNDTLTREEAAVIAAKILAGAKAVEWTAATTRFTDVVDAWSFAFINYVDEENVMIGNANGEFNPKATLQIDEAIKIALAIADAKAAFNASVEMAKNPTMPWWTFYVQGANNLGLTDGMAAIRNYQAKCSRGMFAQLIYNAFELGEEHNDIAKNFGYDDIKAYVDVDDNGIVTLKPVDPAKDTQQKITAELFNEALKAAGYTETAADLEALNGQVYLSWLKTETELKIVAVEILTAGKVVLYNDAEIKLENAYSDMNKDGKVEINDTDRDPNYIIIGGVKYQVGVLDNTTGNSVLGGADIETVGIAVTKNGAAVKAGELEKLPEFYKAFLYDDDGDGDFERCDYIEYAIATVKKTAASAADKADQYTVNFVGGASVGVNKDEKTAAKFSGLDVVADDETPMLIQVGVAPDCTVDVIEVAATKTGEVTGIVTGTSIKIGGETVKFNTKFVAPDHKYLSQDATIFTIADKYVKVASVSSSEQTLMVESVKIDANGNAVVTGYDVNKQFAKAEITVIGIVKNSKLNPLGAFRGEIENVDGSKTADKVYLAAKKDAKEIDRTYFNDGVYYTFVKASKGFYLKSTGSHITRVVSPLENGVKLYKFSVGDYVKYTTASNGTAVAKYNVDAPAVVVSMNDAKAGAKDVYDAVKYSITTSIDLANANAAVKLNDAGKVKVVYIAKDSIGGTDTITSPLAEGNTIVQIVAGAHEIGFAANVYKAVDLFNNKVVDVVGNAAVGSYYVADAEYKLVDDKAIDNTWVFDHYISQITVRYNGGLLPIVKAYSTQLSKDVTETDYHPVRVQETGKQKEYSVVNQIKIYEGEWTLMDDNGTEDTADDIYQNIITRKDNGANPVAIDVNNFVARNKDNDGIDLYAGYHYDYTETVKAEDATAEKPAGDYIHTVTFEAVDTYVVGDTMIIVIDIDDVVTEMPGLIIAPIVPAA